MAVTTITITITTTTTSTTTTTFFYHQNLPLFLSPIFITYIYHLYLSLVSVTDVHH